MYGKFVISAAGHDTGKIYIVIGTASEDGVVYIADGKVRKVNTPKKKKLKHLVILDVPAAGIPEDVSGVSNRQLVNEIKRIRAEAEMQ